jgi:hypothetical protein
MTKIQHLYWSCFWYKTSYIWYMLAHPAKLLFPDAFVTGICLLILLCFVPGCTRLACLNAAHLLHLKGTLGKKQGNHSFKSYKVARCRQAPRFPRAPRRPRASAAARAARAANLHFKVVLYRP